MNSLKTAEELFYKYYEWYTDHDKEVFLQALTEHDAEIIKLIDEMMKEEDNKVYPNRNDYVIKALTELQDKLFPKE